MVQDFLQLIQAVPALIAVRLCIDISLFVHRFDIIDLICRAEDVFFFRRVPIRTLAPFCDRDRPAFIGKEVDGTADILGYLHHIDYCLLLFRGGDVSDFYFHWPCSNAIATATSVLFFGVFEIALSGLIILCLAASSIPIRKGNKKCTPPGTGAAANHQVLSWPLGPAPSLFRKEC